MGLKERIEGTLQSIKDAYHRNIVPSDPSTEFKQFVDEVYKGKSVEIPLNNYEPDTMGLDYYGKRNGSEIGRLRFWCERHKFEKSFHILRNCEDNSFLVTEEKFYDLTDPSHS